MDQTTRRALYARSDQNQTIPKARLKAMAGIALAALALTTFGVLTDRPHEAQIHTAPVVKQLLIEINESATGGTIITDMEGNVLADTGPSERGFYTVVRSGLEFNRRKARIEGNPPVTLLRFADGRVGLRDDATGWKISLVGFGQDNARYWYEIIDRQGEG